MRVEASRTYERFQSIESKVLLHDLVEKDNSQYVLHIHRTPGKYIVESHLLQWSWCAPEGRRKVDTELYLPSITRNALEKDANFGLNGIEIAYAISVPVATLRYPEAMKRAQDEIDALVGSSHLPEFTRGVSSTSLAYTGAPPTAPLALPHSVITDVIYEDEMFIPSQRAMSKDEECGTDVSLPEEFRPERYLADGNLVHLLILPFSLASEAEYVPVLPSSPCYYLTHFSCPRTVRILWAFDISPPLDEKGMAMLPSTDDFIDSLVGHPRPFEFLLQPRKEVAHSIITEEWKRAEEEASAWM
ncbi:hypothetical protein BDZ97DRAFT_2057027 [Flammula alnicola]|nr:hypothetical protein BDZ97DRAFT_2057027 [Flammula alnicola]